MGEGGWRGTVSNSLEKKKGLAPPKQLEWRGWERHGVKEELRAVKNSLAKKVLAPPKPGVQAVAGGRWRWRPSAAVGAGSLARLKPAHFVFEGVQFPSSRWFFCCCGAFPAQPTLRRRRALTSHTPLRLCRRRSART